jgi:hypothetical protein
MGSELAQCRVEPHLPPSSSPIRRIVDDSIVLTWALAFNGWGHFLLRPCNDDVTIVPAT